MSVVRTATRRRAQTNREAWLTEALRQLRPYMARRLDRLDRETGEPTVMPQVRVSVGWPGGRRKKGTILGQCWSGTAATDNRAQIFISPIVSDGRVAVAILAHEYVHAIDKNEHGHDLPFARLAARVGLEGKPTETHPGADLAQFAQFVVGKLGKYPHAALCDDATDGTKKQTTRMLKLECACPEPRILRLSRKAIDAGPILCGVCETEFADHAAADDAEWESLPLNPIIYD